jgi:hypothetical protein
MEHILPPDCRPARDRAGRRTEQPAERAVGRSHLDPFGVVVDAGEAFLP